MISPSLCDNEIEDSVAGWLWEIRQCCELECTSILVAKSLLDNDENIPKTLSSSSRADCQRQQLEEENGQKCSSEDDGDSACGASPVSSQNSGSQTSWAEESSLGIEADQQPNCSSAHSVPVSTNPIFSIEPATPVQLRTKKATQCTFNLKADDAIYSPLYSRPVKIHKLNGRDAHFGQTGRYQRTGEHLYHTLQSKPTSIGDYYCCEEVRETIIKRSSESEQHYQRIGNGSVAEETNLYSRDATHCDANTLALVKHLLPLTYRSKMIIRDSDVLGRTEMATVAEFLEILVENQNFSGQFTDLDSLHFCATTLDGGSPIFEVSLEFEEALKEICDRFLFFVFETTTGQITASMQEPKPDESILDSCLMHFGAVLQGTSDYNLLSNGVQNGVTSKIARICRKHQNNTSIVNHAFKALSILTRDTQAARELIQLNFVEFLIDAICTTPTKTPDDEQSIRFVAAKQATGILANITNGSNTFAFVSSRQYAVFIEKLIDVAVSSSTLPNELLAVTTVLANLAVQLTTAVQYLYRFNIVVKLAAVVFPSNGGSNRTKTLANDSLSLEVQDQLATIFCRMSANSYDEALIGQGAVRCLLSMLQNSMIIGVREPSLVETAKRVKYKAAISLGQLGAKSYGLQEILGQNGANVLLNMLRREDEGPVLSICKSLLGKLEDRYQLESEV